MPKAPRARNGSMELLKRLFAWSDGQPMSTSELYHLDAEKQQSIGYASAYIQVGICQLALDGFLNRTKGLRQEQIFSWTSKGIEAVKADTLDVKPLYITDAPNPGEVYLTPFEKGLFDWLMSAQLTGDEYDRVNENMIAIADVADRERFVKKLLTVNVLILVGPETCGRIFRVNKNTVSTLVVHVLSEKDERIAQLNMQIAARKAELEAYASKRESLALQIAGVKQSIDELFSAFDKLIRDERTASYCLGQNEVELQILQDRT